MVDPFQAYLDKKLAPFTKFVKKEETLKRIDEQLTPAIKSYVKASIPKTLPSLNPKEVSQMIEKAISSIPKVKPPERVIREIKTIEKVIEPKEEINALKRELGAINEVLDRLKGMIIMRTSLPSAGSSSIASSGANPFIIGNWRFYDDGTNLIVQKNESGTWNEKGSFLP